MSSHVFAWLNSMARRLLFTHLFAHHVIAHRYSSFRFHSAPAQRLILNVSIQDELVVVKSCLPFTSYLSRTFTSTLRQQVHRVCPLHQAISHPRPPHHWFSNPVPVYTSPFPQFSIQQRLATFGLPQPNANPGGPSPGRALVARDVSPTGSPWLRSCALRALTLALGRGERLA